MQKPSVSLIIVAILFVMMGVLSAVGMVEKIMAGSLFVNFDFLGLLIGPGLLRRKQGWRTCALVFIWISMILGPIIAAVFMYLGGPLDLTIFGRKIGQAPVAVGVGIGVAVFVVNFWMFRVLVRPDVRAYFGLSPKNIRPVVISSSP